MVSHGVPGRLRLNPHLAALPPYNAGINAQIARDRSGRSDVARLASNENPDGCSPAVLAALDPLAYEPWRYADPACTALRRDLGQYLGADPELIVVGNGSEEMIAALARTVLQPGDTVVTVVPSFGLHEIEPLALGARVIKVPMTPELGFDIEALAAAIAAGPRLVFLGSPWNPVGPALDAVALARLAASVPSGTLFVLDEAYHEYAPRELIPDGLEFLTAAEIDHVVLRTFSKAYGLAGLRVGYAICSDGEIARVLRAAKTPFNVNAAAQAATRAALADQGWMENSVARCVVERERLAADLRGLELRVAPSATNFLFVDSGHDSATVADWLLGQGIIVKPWREPGYTSWLRVTVGHRPDNERFLLALSDLLQAPTQTA